MKSGLLLLLFLVNPVFGQPEKTDTVEKAKEMGDESVEKAKQVLASARENRGFTSWNLGAHYSFFETWVPGKWGVSVSYTRTPSSVYELEYTRGSFGLGYFGADVGRVTEQRLSLLWRSFGERNSFHWISGVNYTRLEARLGSEYLGTVSGIEQSVVDLVALETFGVTVGLGNRWQTAGGLNWGFDWLVMHLPLVTVSEDDAFTRYTSNLEYARDVGDVLMVFKRIPTFAVAKIQVGFSW